MHNGNYGLAPGANISTDCSSTFFCSLADLRFSSIIFFRCSSLSRAASWAFSDSLGVLLGVLDEVDVFGVERRALGFPFFATVLGLTCGIRKKYFIAPYDC
jgi:hypothetical protein